MNATETVWTTARISEVLEKHNLWLLGKSGGERADLIRANLTDANLSRANLSDANLSGANLSGANLICANLIDANLSRANLIRANLSGADLSGANLIRANLTDANLIRADLIRANLSGANLIRADLIRANLTDANLTDANLIRANLTDANLIRADLPLIKKIEGFRTLLLEAVQQPNCLIDMGSWHKCETTHCLAGWCVTIHPEGRLLESIYGTGTAGALILNACGEQIPNFFGTTEGAEARAMNWLKTGEQVDPES